MKRFFILTLIVCLLFSCNNNSNGLSIAFNGDSVTKGLQPHIYSSSITYVNRVNKLLHFSSVKNYAIGGTRLAHVDDFEDCLVDRIQEMDKDVDIIFIMANTNDYASQVPLGEEDSKDVCTYNGALNYIFEYCQNAYPNSIIVVSNMLKRKVNYDKDNNPLEITIDKYAECVKDRALHYGINFYDAYNLSGLDLLRTPKDGSGVSEDGLHPNKKGSILLGDEIAEFLQKIIEDRY